MVSTTVSPMAILRKRGVMRNLLFETETCEPPPRQMHSQFLNKLALAVDAVQIANQQESAATVLDR
jgi:hypothetical protein